MKLVKSFLLLLIGLFCLAACQPKPSEKASGLRIVTSFYPVYAMTKAVSGDLNDVRMIQSSRGIHSFEPSASDIQAIYDADIFFYHSHILEAWAGRLSPSEKQSKVTIVEASKGVDLQRVEGLEDVPVSAGVDEATLYDPHTWLDPVLVGQEVDSIARALAKIDPKNEETYRQNADDVKKEAEAMTQKYQALFAKCKQKQFVTQHTAFAYTAKRFGLEQLGIAGVSEQEPSPRQLAEIKDFIDTYQVRTIFVEKGMSDKMAQALATSTHVELKVLEPLEADPQNSKTFLENLDANLSLLVQSLQ